MNPFCHKGQTLSYLLLTLGLTLPALPAFSQLFVEWNKTYGGLGWEEFQTVNKTDDGGYIFGGFTNTLGPSPGTEVSDVTRDTAVFPDLTGDVWLVKTDGLGNVEWDKRYGGFDQDRMWSVSQTPDGGFVFCGESLSGADLGTEHTEFNRGGFDYWLVKTDADGNHLWNRTYGGSENDIGRVVIPLDDGYLLLGYSWSSSIMAGDKTEDSRGAADFWIIKLNLDGNIMWDRTLGGDGNDWLYDAELLPDGNVLCTGWSESGLSGEKTDPSYGFNDYWVMKIDPSDQAQAEIIWQRTLGGEGRDVPLDIFLTNDNAFVICGHSSSPAGGMGNKTSPHYGLEDGWIVKMREEGNTANIVWQRSYGGESADIAYAAAETSLGNLMVVGMSASQPDSMALGKLSPLLGATDFWINYLDPDGSRQWDFSMGGLNAETCVKIVPAHDYGFIFGGHSQSNEFEPYKSDNSRGLNDIFVIRTGCAIDPPGLEADTITCTNEFITLDATVDSCLFCQYIWDDGTTGPIRIVAPDSAVDLRVTVVHPDGCEISDSVSLEIVPGIDTMLPAFAPVSCFGEADAEFFVEEVIGGTPPYQFSFNGGPWEDNVYYANLPPGFYDLAIVDTNGCTYDTSFFIDQPQEVLVELGDDIYLPLGDSVQLQAMTNLVDSFTFSWGQPDELSCLDCLEPWVQPEYTTTYTIRLRDKNSCEASDNIRVIVDRESSVYIPNAFSPNNDNANDFFTVYADPSVRQVNYLLIFDRWGEQLFERYNFQPNIDQLGWNGRLDGKFMQPAVFAYAVEVEYIDGRTEVLLGDVTLVR